MQPKAEVCHWVKSIDSEAIKASAESKNLQFQSFTTDLEL
ncbi:hypothetical protein Cal6303_4850 [Calothrix sp. PCC 6303]|nr:hypothetical protein Cal6303_4850 [Calothrix sp. PCC 6303]